MAKWYLTLILIALTFVNKDGSTEMIDIGQGERNHQKQSLTEPSFFADITEYPDEYFTSHTTSAAQENDTQSQTSTESSTLTAEPSKSTPHPGSFGQLLVKKFPPSQHNESNILTTESCEPNKKHLKPLEGKHTRRFYAKRSVVQNKTHDKNEEVVNSKYRNQIPMSKNHGSVMPIYPHMVLPDSVVNKDIHSGRLETSNGRWLLNDTSKIQRKQPAAKREVPENIRGIRLRRREVQKRRGERKVNCRSRGLFELEAMLHSQKSLKRHQVDMKRAFGRNRRNFSTKLGNGNVDD